MTFFDKKLVGFLSREKKHTRWSKSGVWQHIFEGLAANADNEYAMIDSTIVRAHQHSAGAKKRGPKSRQSGAAVAG